MAPARTLADSADRRRSSESQTVLSQNWEDFLLSKSRLSKGDIVYDTPDSLCLRLKLKAVRGGPVLG